MKRFLIIIVTCIMSFSLFLFVGCSNTLPDNGWQSDTEQNIPEEEPTDDGNTDTPEENDTGAKSEPDNEQNPSDESDQSDEDDKKEIKEMYITIYGNKLKVTLAENSSVSALIALLKQGNITYTADDYGGFEKVGNIGHTLPRNDTQINTEAGDVILYQGNNLCLYYGNNSWNFTKIGKISGHSATELQTLLGAGKGCTDVTLSLE